MIAGAPGACGSLVSLSSSGETGRNPTPAFASRAANIHTTSPNTTHLLKRTIVISPEVISPEVIAGSTEVSTNKICCRREPRTQGGQAALVAATASSASSELPGPLEPESGPTVNA